MAEEKHDTISDAQLLVRFSEGDEEAFRTLVNRYRRGLYAFLRRFLNSRELAEDIFQETFLQLFMSRESFDPSRPLRPWLFTIAANKAKDALRKEQRNAAMVIGTVTDDEQMSFQDVLNAIASDKVEPTHNLERDETTERVRQVISNMPDNLREILIMSYFNKFSYKHMATILGIPIGTVKSRLHTAVHRFMKDYKSAVGSTKSK